MRLLKECEAIQNYQQAGLNESFLKNIIYRLRAYLYVTIKIFTYINRVSGCQGVRVSGWSSWKGRRLSLMLFADQIPAESN